MDKRHHIGDYAKVLESSQITVCGLSLRQCAEFWQKNSLFTAEHTQRSVINSILSTLRTGVLKSTPWLIVMQTIHKILNERNIECGMWGQLHLEILRLFYF